MRAGPRSVLTAVGITVVALALGGCAGGMDRARDVSAPASSAPVTPTPSPRLDPPPDDGPVVGSLAKAAVPPPHGFRIPLSGPRGTRTGPFTLRGYVRTYFGGSKELLADLRLCRMRRGWHGFAESRDGRTWLHIYLFEARNNYGATSLQSMLFGSTTAEPYQPRMDDVLGQIERNRDAGGRYTAVRIAFVTGNVYAVVIVSRRGMHPPSSLTERLAAAQRRRLRAAIAPNA